MRKASSYAAVLLGICVAAGTAAGQRATQERPTQERAGAEKIINGPVVEGTGPTWAAIAWTTNTGGSTVLRYGTDRDHLSETAESPYADNEKTKSQTHRVRLKDLKPKTTYYFRADSGQGEGTGTDAKSDVRSFRTKAK